MFLSLPLCPGFAQQGSQTGTLFSGASVPKNQPNRFFVPNADQFSRSGKPPRVKPSTAPRFGSSNLSDFYLSDMNMAGMGDWDWEALFDAAGSPAASDGTSPKPRPSGSTSTHSGKRKAKLRRDQVSLHKMAPATALNGRAHEFLLAAIDHIQKRRMTPVNHLKQILDGVIPACNANDPSRPIDPQLAGPLLLRAYRIAIDEEKPFRVPAGVTGNQTFQFFSFDAKNPPLKQSRTERNPLGGKAKRKTGKLEKSIEGSGDCMTDETPGSPARKASARKPATRKTPSRKTTDNDNGRQPSQPPVAVLPPDARRTDFQALASVGFPDLTDFQMDPALQDFSESAPFPFPMTETFPDVTGSDFSNVYSAPFTLASPKLIHAPLSFQDAGSASSDAHPRARSFTAPALGMEEAPLVTSPASTWSADPFEAALFRSAPVSSAAVLRFKDLRHFFRQSGGDIDGRIAQLEHHDHVAQAVECARACFAEPALRDRILRYAKQYKAAIAKKFEDTHSNGTSPPSSTEFPPRRKGRKG